MKTSKQIKRPETEHRLNVNEAADYCHVSPHTWYQWLGTGELDSITHRTPGGRRYWFRDEIDGWFRSRCSQPTNGTAGS